MSTSLRVRIIAAARTVTASSGWAAVRMGDLADMIGVSRQTVYKEIGSKPKLAEILVLSELERFLAVVERAFDRHPDDVVEAIRAACKDVLVHARGNPLLHAVVTASHGADNDLLPLLTTRSHALVTTAKEVVGDRLAGYAVALPEPELTATVDLVVRTILSHVMQPDARPQATADGIALVAARLLRAP
ncbi:TetR family transcriptional regulator [Actinosynnema sp. CA-248983]